MIQNIRKFSLQINGKVLDVGCGSKPYKNEFINAKEYIGMDIELSGHDHRNEDIDIFYDGEKFPFSDASFDSVLTFEVMEHIFEPINFIKEINRVLKIDGLFLITVPFIWDEHEKPYDYGRYTSFGLKYILENNGFQIINNEKSVKDLRVMFQLFNVHFNKKLLSKKVPKILYYIFTIIHSTFFNLIGSIVFIFSGKNPDIYLNNIILAKKIK